MGGIYLHNLFWTWAENLIKIFELFQKCLKNVYMKTMYQGEKHYGFD